MKIDYRMGNLFDDPDLEALVHSCNAQAKFAAGFAKEVRTRYVGAYNAYMHAHNTTGLRLGDYSTYHAPDGVLVINAIGQRYYGREKRRYVSYDALVVAMERIDQEIDVETIMMPPISTSLGGGDWKITSAIIESCFQRIQPIVYLLDGKMPK
jgi:O-acetyl-ADP-ribose deacetylase (regulator of RNase III)